MTSKWRLTASLFAIFCAVLLAGDRPAKAATSTFNLTVGATVTGASCASLSASAIAFTYVSGQAIDATANSTVSVTCSNGSPWSIDGGQGTSQGVPIAGIRGMTQGTNHLGYQLYTASGLGSANQFGTGEGGIAGVNMITGTGTGTAQTPLIYGKVPLGQSVSASAAYTDTVVLTITF